MNPFQTLITQDSEINRIQGNISNALNQASPVDVVTVDKANYALKTIPGLLIIPTSNISGGSQVNVYLPDALKIPGQGFFFKKTDSTSNQITFSSPAKNKQGQNQTVEAASSYSNSSALAYGRLVSDGNNWWLV